MLSNFFMAPIRVRRHDILPEFARFSVPEYASWIPEYGDGVVFPSSEHFWHSLKALDRATFNEFTINGRLAKLEPDAFALFEDDPAEALKCYTNHKAKGAVGILAKKAVARTYEARMKSLGFRLGYYDRNTAAATVDDADVELAVWTQILTLKFEQNTPLRLILMRTGNATLYEPPMRGKVHHWNGKKNAETGEIEGANTMGRYLMAVRSVMRLFPAEWLDAA